MFFSFRSKLSNTLTYVFGSYVFKYNVVLEKLSNMFKHTRTMLKLILVYITFDLIERLSRFCSLTEFEYLCIMKVFFATDLAINCHVVGRGIDPRTKLYIFKHFLTLWFLLCIVYRGYISHTYIAHAYTPGSYIFRCSVYKYMFRAGIRYKTNFHLKNILQLYVFQYLLYSKRWNVISRATSN